jgi:hypothetical protein
MKIGWWRTIVLSVSVLMLSACGSDPTSGLPPADAVANKVTGNVHEWGIDLSGGIAKAGEVTFAIANFGTTRHEFLVVKTNYAPGKIPVGSGGRFDEKGGGVDVVDEIPEFDVDSTHILKTVLSAGSYQLLCNIAGHYQNGMFFAFEVK